MLLLDECGQLSSQQFALMDIVFRHSRNSSQPFGGVLICGSFDHCQIESIDGLPFLISLNILLDYTIVRLEHSVRASRDKQLQVSAPSLSNLSLFCMPSHCWGLIYVFSKRIQQITRMSPFVLVENQGLRKEFTQLMNDNIRFVESFDAVDINTQRIYHRRRPATASMERFIDKTTTHLKDIGRDYIIAESKDYRKHLGSLAQPTLTNEWFVVDLLNQRVREC